MTLVPFIATAAAVGGAPGGGGPPGWGEVVRTLTLRGGYNTNVVIVGTTLLGIAAGIIGVFALLRKRALMSDALSHATLPGIALAFLLATALGFDGRTLPNLLVGAAATGVLGVVCVQLLLRHTRLREDAAIGIVLSVFFGAGIVLLSLIQTVDAGNAAGLDKFIYGQTAAMSAQDAALMGGIALLAVLATLLLLKEFAIVCFNDAFAQVDGWPVSAIDLAMMALVVIVTVAGLQAVGLILVVAMLIVPPVAARMWTERLRRLVVLAGALGGLGGYLGSALSALLPRYPAGAVIVLASGAIFLVSLAAAPARGVAAQVARRSAMRLRVATEHLLEAAYEHEADTGGPFPRELLDRLARRRGWRAWRRRAVVLALRATGRARKDGDGALVLTDRGRADGARVSRNHRLWEEYLITCADVAPGHVDWSADQVEHVLSPELVRSLERALTARGVRVPAHPAHPGAEGGR